MKLYDRFKSYLDDFMIDSKVILHDIL